MVAKEQEPNFLRNSLSSTLSMSDDHIAIFKLIVVHKKITKKNKDFYNPLKPSR